MTGANTNLTSAVETYFVDLGRVRVSGGATAERSNYPAIANLLNAVGATLKPKVFCVGELAHQGAGHPDFGLYAAKQKGRAREGQTPERGVVEVKTSGDDAWLTAGWGHYGTGAALGDSLPALGESTFDVHVNARAFWCNVPSAVWSYKLGGYQVLKKWLSYRERPILGRTLRPEEVQRFAEMARRIAAVMQATHDKTHRLGIA